MRAIVAPTLELTDVPEPVPGPGQAMVEIHHAAANFGELRHLDYFADGAVLGFDAAGVVVAAAADGSGPAAGTRVAGIGQGVWAERVAFDTAALAVVPGGVDLAEAASLPTVGITALRTLREPLDGRRVLITGASGGVGRLAVQLARRGGAHVIAAAARGDGLRELGAAEVVTGLDGLDPVDVVLEHVGGATLVAAWGLVKPGGILHSIGWASGEPARFAPYATISLGPARRLHTFGDASDPGKDLAGLLDLVAAGEVRAQIGWRGPWERIGEAATALLDRKIAGKIVLDLPASHDEIETRQ